MSFGVFIQPNPVWAFLDQVALPAAGGFIYTYQSSDHQTPKATYQNNDINNLVPWSNPITLDATGKQADELTDTVYPIFWADDEPYYIEITDSDNNIIFQGDGFPWDTGVGPTVTETDIQNYFINAQLYFDNADIINASGDRGFNDLPSTELAIAPDAWFFIKNNTSATDTITIVDFEPGQDEVPNNPKAYFVYNCTVPGTSETQKKYNYKFSSVRNFAGDTLNLQFYGRSILSSQLQVTYTQYFGTGGSPSATNIQPITTKSLGANWTLYQVTFDIDALTSKNIGTNGDDYFSIDFNMPLNGVANVQLANECLRFGETFVDIQEESVNFTSVEIKASELPLPRSVNWDDGNYYLKMVSGIQTWLPCAGIGGVCYTNDPPIDALLCNGLPYFQSQYYNLAQKNLIEGWGTGPQGFTASNGGTATVTATCFSNGTVVSGSSGITPFTYTQTNNGGAMAQGIATILCTAASTLTPGMYFFINSPAIDTITAIQYYVWFSLNNETKDPGVTVPALSGKTGIKVPYTGTETDIEVAALVTTQLSVAHFRVPDSRGLLDRMPNFGATGVLPLPTRITFTSVGNDTGVTFAIVGLDMNGAPLSENLTGANAGVATSVRTYSAVTSITPNNNIASTITVGYTSDADGLCESQSGTAATPLIIDGVFSRDPDYLTRYAIYTGGATGDNVGSQQHNQNRKHRHPASVFGDLGNGDFFKDSPGTGGEGEAHTNDSGGNQANPNNIYINKIIYF